MKQIRLPPWLDLRAILVVLVSLMMVERVPGHNLPLDLIRKTVYVLAFLIAVAQGLQAMTGGAKRAGGPPGRIIEANRDKATKDGKTEFLHWVCIEVALPPPFADGALFAVFDGHGGKRVSNLAADTFSKVLSVCAAGLLRNGGRPTKELALAAGISDLPEEKEEALAGDADGMKTDRADEEEEEDDEIECQDIPSEVLRDALHYTMLTLDQLLRRGGAEGADVSDASEVASVLQAASGANGVSRANARLSPSAARNAFDLMGSTAIIAIVDSGHSEGESSASSSRKPRRLTVANCGDSRAVLCREGGRALELSEDHKPELPRESARIRSAGGSVEMVHPSPCHRVDGWGLNLSRALGDFHYKARPDLSVAQQKVTAVPEIKTLELEDKDEFILLGCDGVFELHTSQDAVDSVRRRLQDGSGLREAVEDLLDSSCSVNPMKTQGRGTDNVSAIVVQLPGCTEAPSM
eukprot:TRINITY_DN28403_c0_g2_i1.p1 TRINITY_DN28403_c0_g2~~TRINITY_DN28403_c0_g2_i1.p1  ORF type:complete len:466 (+),score=87.05 TRINITY_DN28403_c0_g2_i1:96-1493(+)